MLRAAFCTLATGEYYYQGGTANLVKSANRFHPDVPFFVFRDKEISAILSIYQGLMASASLSLPENIRPSPPFKVAPMNYYHALIGKTLAQEFDMVIYMDCDSLIVAPLDEVFNEDYEIAGVRNIADNGKAGCCKARVDGIDPLKYLNAGFLACRRKDFWDIWMLCNHKFDFYMPMSEQFMLNMLFHHNEYKTLLLDPPESKVYYGIASAYGEKHHWESWQNITIENDLLKLDGKTIKVLHEAGGPHLPKMDLDSKLLPKHVSDWIKEKILLYPEQ